MAEQTRNVAAVESTVSVVESVNDEQQDVPTLRLRLKKPKPKKSVQWRQGTIDNEHMNKKKSKCCCQYQKPHEFDESSSDEDDDDECDNCHGHVERKKKTQPIPESSDSPNVTTDPSASTSNPIP